MTLTEIKAEAAKNVIRINATPNGSTTEVIDLNINTNVTVSNAKVSKSFQICIVSLVFVLAAAFAVVQFNVKGDLHALKDQVRGMDTKLKNLMSKYEKVSSRLNRVRSHLTYDKFYQSATPPDAGKLFQDPAISSEEQSVEIHKRLNDSGLIKVKLNPENANGGIDLREKVFNEEESKTRSFGEKRISFTENNGDTKDAKDVSSSEATAAGYLRVNLTSEGRDRNTQFADYENEDYLDPWNEPRTGRARRDDGRGKIRRKSDPRPKRSRRRLGPLVATFIGGVPDQYVTNGAGFIGPWVKRVKEGARYDLNKFHLVDDNKSIEVTVNGLYMISAQIFYFGKHKQYSYWILLNSEGASSTQKISKCSTVSDTDTSEVSCHTSLVLPLLRGDRIRIQQQERDRWVNLREGHSYIQLILLSSETRRRPTR